MDRAMNGSGAPLPTFAPGVLGVVVVLAVWAAAGAVRRARYGNPGRGGILLLGGVLWWLGSALGLFTLLAACLMMLVLTGIPATPDGDPSDGAAYFGRAILAAALLSLMLTGRDLLQVCRLWARPARWGSAEWQQRPTGRNRLTAAVIVGPEILGGSGRCSACLGAFAGPVVSGVASAFLVGRWIVGSTPAWALDVFLGFWLGPFTMDALARPLRPREAAACCLTGGVGGLLAVAAVLGITARFGDGPGGLPAALVMMAVPLVWSAALVAAGFALRGVQPRGLSNTAGQETLNPLP
jgi:hypothetical protein